MKKNRKILVYLQEVNQVVPTLHEKRASQFDIKLQLGIFQRLPQGFSLLLSQGLIDCENLQGDKCFLDNTDRYLFY